MPVGLSKPVKQESDDDFDAPPAKKPEPVKTTPTILETPKKEKTLISNQAAEELFTEIKVVDEPSNETTTNTITNTQIPGLEEFKTRLKGFPTNATLIAYIKKNNLTLPKEKIRDGYEKRLIDAFKDGKIDLANP